MMLNMPRAAFLSLVFTVHCVSSYPAVPDFFTTILHYLYSKIPPIRKGTDSRLGVGFRLGEHADFQILLELGPQKRTDPIGNDIDSNRRNIILIGPIEAIPGSKRHEINQNTELDFEKILSNYNEQLKKKEQAYKKTEEQNEGSEWLSKWRREVGNPSESTWPEVIPIKTVSHHVNRIKVVESASNLNNAKYNDFINLKRLFESASR